MTEHVQTELMPLEYLNLLSSIRIEDAPNLKQKPYQPEYSKQAEKILHCVKMHDELVAALEEAWGLFETKVDDEFEWAKMADELLTKAKRNVK